MIDLNLNLTGATDFDSIAAELGILISKFPDFRFFNAPVGRHSARWIGPEVSGLG